jgi:hypothetical protein
MTVPPAPPSAPAPPPPAGADDAAAFDAVFGRGADGAPAWLRTAAFEGASFDAEAYIGEAKKLVRKEGGNRRIDRARSPPHSFSIGAPSPFLLRSPWTRWPPS